MDSSMATPARRSGRFSPLLSEIEIALESEFFEVVDTEFEIRTARLAEDLSQSVRRMRLVDGFRELAGALADSAAPFCEKCAVFEAVGENMALRAGRGVTGGAVVPLNTAGAFQAAAESGDPVSALATPAEVSQAVVNLFAHTSVERISIFPIGTFGLLYASGKLQPAVLELLAQVAGLAGAAAASEPEPAGLVTIAPATEARLPQKEPTADGHPSALMTLDPKEHRAHLRAQQFARTRVAQMRLHEAQALSTGRLEADIYGALTREIDALREAFKEKFLPAAPTMVDYVHLELLRTLANDDPALLGPGYPGPLV